MAHAVHEHRTFVKFQGETLMFKEKNYSEQGTGFCFLKHLSFLNWTKNRVFRIYFIYQVWGIWIDFKKKKKGMTSFMNYLNKWDIRTQSPNTNLTSTQERVQWVHRFLEQGRLWQTPPRCHFLSPQQSPGKSTSTEKYPGIPSTVGSGISEEERKPHGWAGSLS